MTAVSTIRRLPLGLGGTSSSSFTVEGYVPAKNEEMMAYTHVLGPDYFHTMNTPLVAGREFTPNDTDLTQNVVVVNQTFAKRYFAKSNPIGQRVRGRATGWWWWAWRRTRSFRAWMNLRRRPCIFRWRSPSLPK